MKEPIFTRSLTDAERTALRSGLRSGQAFTLRRGHILLLSADRQTPRRARKKKARDRLIRLAESHPDWVLGYADEIWWSRLRQPRLSSWAERDPLRLIEQVGEKADPDPKALACYGLLRADTEEVWLRFVDGRLISGVTIQFLEWTLPGPRVERWRSAT